MENYIMLDGKKIPISDETAESFKKQFSEPERDLKKGDIVYYPSTVNGGASNSTARRAINFGEWESKSENTILRAEMFIKLQNYADKVNGMFADNREYRIHWGRAIKKFNISCFACTSYEGRAFSSKAKAEQAIDHFGEDFIKLYLGV